MLKPKAFVIEDVKNVLTNVDEKFQMVSAGVV